MNRIAAYAYQSLQESYPQGEIKALPILICCDMSGLDALDIYTGESIILSECKQCESEDITFRLQKNESVQYVCGFVEFCGRNSKVAPSVLIPRSEAAELVELAIKENPSARYLLGIGTGSGYTVISPDRKLPDIDVGARDTSEEVLAIICGNNEDSEVGVGSPQRGVLLDDWEKVPSSDVIASNPPYVTEIEKNKVDTNVLDRESGLTLFVPDEDPLQFYNRIVCLGNDLLLPGGKFYSEINQAYGRETAYILGMNQYRDVRVIRDILRKDRIVTANR